MTPLPRSWLIVPASNPDAIDAALRSGADAVVLDLVERVADNDAPVARENASQAKGPVRVFVQTDPMRMDVDVDAALPEGAAGVVLSRAESPQQIEALDAALTRVERARGIEAGRLRIVPALETAQGNHAAYDILRASHRVAGATLGRADLVMDLGPEPSGEIHLMPYLMQRLVIVANAVGVAPIGAWWRAPDRGLHASAERTYEAAKRGRAIGFKGAMCLEPDQVDALNRAYA